MSWRDQFSVHPAADVFPMMSDDELDALGEDIKSNGVRVPIGFWHPAAEPKLAQLIDGRNRLEAAERVGLDINDIPTAYVHCSDPTAWVISLNIHRRHLTKAQQAELIVQAIKAEEKPPQHEEVSKGGRGKVNPVKAKAVAVGAEHGISKATVERAIAKAEGKTSKPKPVEDEAPNCGCNYDPADPRGWYKDEGSQVVRRRAWLNMAEDSVQMAESFLAEGGHRAIAVADATEIDGEISAAVWRVVTAWGRVHSSMQRKAKENLTHEA